MKASELIKALEKTVRRYGDLPVRDWRDGFSATEIEEVRIYTEDGHEPDKRRKDRQPHEIVLY